MSAAVRALAALAGGYVIDNVIYAGNTLPAVRREEAPDKGVAVVGIHTPEFDHEAQPANVARRVKEFGIAYPVLPDPDQLNCRRWKQQFWPAVYLVDRKGMIRYRWDGEMNFSNLDGERKMTKLIEQLLQESL
ncbi:MAG: hypothetical protein SFV51_01790 [Bryobacteraceae bacterium]|nr:hypothetical protein [Bryobacteraceae bacterium]